MHYRTFYYIIFCINNANAYILHILLRVSCSVKPNLALHVSLSVTSIDIRMSMCVFARVLLLWDNVLMFYYSYFEHIIIK